MRIMPLVSPLNWFSWMLGAGAAGTLAAGTLHLAEPLPAIAAAVGAVGFAQAVVKPVLNLALSFVSKPAQGLEGCLMQEVEAVTGFNERGEGLVRVCIDGRSDDVLAQLTDEEMARGLRVHRGERLLIEDVDPRTNTCRVSRS